VLLHNHDPWPPTDRLSHYRRCVNPRSARGRLARYAAAQRRWRASYNHVWPIRYNRLSAGDRAWAVNTGACESGNNPATNTGNGFYGLLQFTLPTARAAGFTRRPDLTSWHEQATRAVWWMHKTSPGQWPVCG
jgi:hypothetical protein